MLLDDIPQTMKVVEGSLRRARGIEADGRAPELYLESLGISDEEKTGVVELSRQEGPVDPVVAYLVAATNGLMYSHLVGKLDRHPIPEIPLPAGNGRRLLDVGCSWGRWCIAASAKGYEVVGIDPSLGAVMAARRVARRMGLPNRYVVADARHLPFPKESIDCTYSYSVLQHLSRADTAQSVAEMGRVLKPGGTAKVQMPTRFGIRCLYHQVRRAFREGVGFEVRYWTLPELRLLFTRCVGKTRFEADCYFGIGLQQSDQRLMTSNLRLIVRASERLKAASHRVASLVWLADSVFAESVKSSHAIHCSA
jgi:SAM-dependent methyltransferase